MKVIIRRFNYPDSGQEAGAILTAFIGKSIKNIQKKIIKNALVEYAFNTLYLREYLILYREFYPDTISIVVIKKINEMNHQELEI